MTELADSRHGFFLFGDQTGSQTGVAHTMTTNWYALRSKPNREEALWREARARGHDVFLPRTRVHTVNPRARPVRPLFPGYLFVRADLHSSGCSAFNWLPYSNGLVSFGSEPAPVPVALVEAIRRRVQAIEAAGGEALEGLQRGDAVSIQGGPFAGSQAIFDARLSGTERVRVLLQLLSRQQVPLDLPTGYIQRTTRR